MEIANGCSLEQLSDFIKKKGNDRKKAVCDITRYQTEDYVRATEQHRHNVSAAIIRGEQLNNFKQRQAHMNGEITEKDNMISTLNKKINQQGADSGNKQEAADKALNSLNNLLPSMNGKSQTQLFKYFEENNNASLIAGMESFVGLLRGQKTANNVDVELYLADFAKLMFKLKRADVEHLTLPIIQIHRTKLEKVMPAFTESSNPDYAVCVEYYPYIKWAVHYCAYAEAQLVSTADKCGSDIHKEELDKAE